MILKRLAKSPIIIACAIGLGANFAGTGIHELPAKTLDLLGRGALPLGLLAVGAGLDFGVVKRSPVALLFSNCLKLMAIPLLTAWLCHLQDVDPTTTGVAILFASPVVVGVVLCHGPAIRRRSRVDGGDPDHPGHDGRGNHPADARAVWMRGASPSRPPVRVFAGF